jgi:hypothetical protein
VNRHPRINISEVWGVVIKIVMSIIIMTKSNIKVTTHIKSEEVIRESLLYSLDVMDSITKIDDVGVPTIKSNGSVLTLVWIGKELSEVGVSAISTKRLIFPKTRVVLRGTKFGERSRVGSVDRRFTHWPVLPKLVSLPHFITKLPPSSSVGFSFPVFWQDYSITKNVVSLDEVRGEVEEIVQ